MPDSPGDQSGGRGIVLHIASTAIPDGRATMQVRPADPDGIGAREIAVSHLGLVLLAAAAQRSDGALIAPLNLRQRNDGRIADEIALLARLGLAEEVADQVFGISPLGRAALDAIENED